MNGIKVACKAYHDWVYNTLPRQLREAAPYVAIGAVTSAAAFMGAKKALDGLVVEVNFVNKDGEPVALQSL